MIPVTALTEIIENLDGRLEQLRRFYNNGPDEHEQVSTERWEVYRKLQREITEVDSALIELEQILALVNEHNEVNP